MKVVDANVLNATHDASLLYISLKLKFNRLKAEKQQRIFGLDIYRAVAIILVVMSHGSLLSGPIFNWLPSVPLPDGVELFFVLSGFLIGTILIRTLDTQERFGGKDLLHFWKRRWFRTLPNYYLILLINYILVASSVIGGDDSLEQFNWKFLLFLHNFNEGFYGFFWESWSLSIEEWFYLILPTLIIGLSFLLDKKKTLIVSIVLLIAVPMIYRWTQADMNYDDFWFDVEIRKVVITRLDTIIYGVLAAFVAYYYPKTWQKSRWVTLVLGLSLMSIVMYLPRPIDTLYGKVFFFTAVSVAAMLMLPWASTVVVNPLGKLGKSIVFISKISYSMYLVNLALVAQVILKNFPPQTLKQHWLAYVGFWIATVAISTALYYLWERPTMKLRDRFTLF